jgi:hypothetical protein
MSADPNRLEHCLERRGAQRFDAHQPLAVHFDGQTVPGFIQNLSGRGIFFYAETALPQGAAVELTFTMPSEITLAENMPVRCRGRVLRASAAQPGQRIGIAAQLSSYEYLPSNEIIANFARITDETAAGITSIPAAR